MAPNPDASAQAIRRAQRELRRNGHRATLERIERADPDPDLTEFLWEELTAIHRQLSRLGGPPRTTQRCYRRVQRLTLLLILTLAPGRENRGGDPDHHG